jgi:hypothetical protein
MPRAAAKTTSQSPQTKPASPPTEPTNATITKDPQLVSIEDFDFTRLVYSEPVTGELPGGKGRFRRVRVGYRSANGKIGPPVVQLSEKQCFGVQPDNIDNKTGLVMTDEAGHALAIRGYQVPIAMWQKDKEPTPTEQTEVEFFDNLTAEFRRYAIENKKKLGKGPKSDDSVRDSVRDVLFRRKKGDKELEALQEGESPYVEGYVPKLYTKLIYYRNTGNCETVFYGPGDKEINPLTLTKTSFRAIPSIRFDSLYIGDKISATPQIYDASVIPRQAKPRQRLAPKNEAPESAVIETAQDDEDGDGLASESGST